MEGLIDQLISKQLCSFSRLFAWDRGCFDILSIGRLIVVQGISGWLVSINVHRKDWYHLQETFCSYELGPYSLELDGTQSPLIKLANEKWFSK